MFFITDAYAQTAPVAANADSPLMSIGFMALIFVAFYFLLIRPQTKRQKELKAMLDALKSGDEIVTTGGIVGKISELSEQYATVQIANVGNQPVQISIQRAAIQTLLPKGTIKSI